MQIKIDNKTIEVSPEDKNIVDIAHRNKIGIPAPCYRSGRERGCCSACVIEVNGKEKYACCTKPLDGMNIIIKREDLDKIRRERIKAWTENPNGGSCSCSCDCSGENENNNSCCS